MANYTKKSKIAVLCSGGLDSAVLLAWCSERYAEVVPIFMECGLRWEAAEWRTFNLFLSRSKLSNLRTAQKLRLDFRDIYGSHWSVDPTQSVPGRGAAWDSVYLPFRNLALLSKAAAYAADNGLTAVALGILKGNPFHDSTAGFLKSLESAVSSAAGRRIKLLAPFRGLRKHQVILLGRRLPLENTLSCIDPQAMRHCGRCTKCHERQEGFRLAQAADSTRYEKSS